MSQKIIKDNVLVASSEVVAWWVEKVSKQHKLYTSADKTENSFESKGKYFVVSNFTVATVLLLFLTYWCCVIMENFELA